MKLALTFPADVDVTIEKSDKALIQTVHVTPLFKRPNARQTFCQIRVIGDNGAERKFAATIGGSDGQVYVHAAANAETRSSFDGLSTAPTKKSRGRGVRRQDKGGNS